MSSQRWEMFGPYSPNTGNKSKKQEMLTLLLTFPAQAWGVRAQFRFLLYLAGSNVVLNWDLTPRPHS
jgi:hypothetical protein